MSARHTARRFAVVSALILAMLAPLLLSAPSASARGLKSIRASYALLTMMNAERRLHGLRPLVMNNRLVLSAHRHDLTMARYDEMSHQLPREAFFGTRIHRAGYRYRTAGENIGWNSRMDTVGTLQLQREMYNEKAPNDGHRLNILNPRFRQVGVYVYFDLKHRKIWLTTDFGTPL